MSQIYTFHEIVTFEENEQYEFKGLEKIRPDKRMEVILDYAKECINAFLNSGGGEVYFGIEDDGRVTGVQLKRNERDDLRKRISQVIHHNFYPSVSPEQYSLKLIPVQDNNQQPELYVIKIQVSSGPSNIYWISQVKSRAYIRRDGGNFPMPPSMIEQRLQHGKDITIDTSSNETSPTEVFQPISTNNSLYLDSGDEDDTILISKGSLICTCSLPIALDQGSIRNVTANYNAEIRHKYEQATK